VIAHDDHQDEMTPLAKHTDRELDRMMAGGDMDDGDLADLAEHLRAARVGLQQPPDEVTHALHLGLVVAAARVQAHSSQPLTGPQPVDGLESRTHRRAIMSRAKSFATKLAATSVAATLATAGLAYAGIDLPGRAAEKAVERVLGVAIPTHREPTEERPTEGAPEDAGNSVADDVHGVIEGTEYRGCEFGQAVADAASANRQNDSEGTDRDPCAATKAKEGAQDSKAVGEGRSMKGRARSSETSGGASDAGPDSAWNHDHGRGRASEAGAGPDNAGNHDAGRGKAREGSTGVRESGAAASVGGGTRKPGGKHGP
jgi:hypothetical protein